MQAEIDASISVPATDIALDGTTAEELERELEDILATGEPRELELPQLPDFDPMPGTDKPHLDSLTSGMQSLNMQHSGTH